MEDGSILQAPTFTIVAYGYNMRDVYRLKHDYAQDSDFRSITIDNPYQCM